MDSAKDIFWLESTVGEDDLMEYFQETAFDYELCKQNPEHARRNRPKRPLEIIAPIRPLTDFQWTVFGDCIVTSTVKASFETAQLSGAEFRTVKCYSSSGLPFEQELFELRVIGWGGMAAPSSGVHVIRECKYCGRRVYSGYTNPADLFDFDGWDGTDLFVIWPLPRYIMILPSVKSWIIENGFSGVVPRELSRLPKVVAGTLTPGSLDDWFDDDKVRAIHCN